MVDANGAYRSVPEALQMARILAELDVSWFEEPLEIEDERGYRELCRLSPVPVAAGENACALGKIVRLIDAGCSCHSARCGLDWRHQHGAGCSKSS